MIHGTYRERREIDDRQTDIVDTLYTDLIVYVDKLLVVEKHTSLVTLTSLKT